MNIPDRDVMKKFVIQKKKPKKWKRRHVAWAEPRELGSEFGLYMTVAVQENMQINADSITSCQQENSLIKSQIMTFHAYSCKFLTKIS